MGACLLVILNFISTTHTVSSPMNVGHVDMARIEFKASLAIAVNRFLKDWCKPARLNRAVRSERKYPDGCIDVHTT